MSQVIAVEELRQLVERVERLQEEKQAIADDIKDVFAEARSRGFDVKAMRGVIRLRAMDQSKRQEAEAVLETYKSALGL